jgi:hypothetical protein
MPNNFERVCGGCTACCLTHAVFAIKKPAGKWCEHCEPGVGCRIYPDRPEGCREGFKCEWLKGEADDSWYPPRSGVVLDLVMSPEPEVGELLQVWEAVPGTLGQSLANPALLDLVKLWRQHFSVCFLFLSGKKLLCLKTR